MLTNTIDSAEPLPGCTTLAPIVDGEAPGADTHPPKRTTAGRFAMLNAFVDRTMAELSRGEIAVWLVLYRDVKNGIASTAQTDIARRAGIDVRTAQRAIRELEKRGLLTVVHRGSLAGGVSKYRLRGVSDAS